MICSFAERGLGQHIATNERLDGRSVIVNGEQMLNFGSCSYLGIERHPRVVAAAHAAVDRFGVQFSSSRTFLELAAYEELESCLQNIFDKPAVVSASTTLGHLAALPVLVRRGDAVVLDKQVHSSVQTAAQLLKASQIPLHVLRHNDMNQLESRVRELSEQYRHVWYLADGVYSMYGDPAPMDDIIHLLQKYEQLHLYIDDAHGMSWKGPRGCGFVRSAWPHHPRMVLLTSLNKSFACAGGAIISPDSETKTLIRNCGSTLSFSGPIPPPMLHAAVASARVHLSDELELLQKELASLVRHTNSRMREANLPQVMECETPIFFLPVGTPDICANLCSRLLREGLHVHLGIFPATPLRAGGLRFCVHRGLCAGDIDRLIDRIQYHYSRTLKEAGSSCEHVAKVFGLEPFSLDAA